MTELAYVPYLDGLLIYEKGRDVNTLHDEDHPEIARLIYTTEVPLTINARTDDMSMYEYDCMMNDVVDHLINERTLYGHEDMLIENNSAAQYKLEMI